jgi:hypothetical protein
MDRLRVPGEHPFRRESMLAWWFVPSSHEQRYFKILECIWTSRAVTGHLYGAILAYFRSILPERDYPLFCEHMQALVASLSKKDVNQCGEKLC